MADGLQVSNCRGCGDEIQWITTEWGKRHPINVKPTKVWIKNKYGKFKLYTGNESHFATCPKAGEFRGKSGD